jgi:hypothetical protein
VDSQQVCDIDAAEEGGGGAADAAEEGGGAALRFVSVLMSDAAEEGGGGSADAAEAGGGSALRFVSVLMPDAAEAGGGAALRYIRGAALRFVYVQVRIQQYPFACGKQTSIWHKCVDLTRSEPS